MVFLFRCQLSIFYVKQVLWTKNFLAICDNIVPLSFHSHSTIDWMKNSSLPRNIMNLKIKIGKNMLSSLRWKISFISGYCYTYVTVMTEHTSDIILINLTNIKINNKKIIYLNWDNIFTNTEYSRFIIS